MFVPLVPRGGIRMSAGFCAIKDQLQL